MLLWTDIQLVTEFYDFVRNYELFFKPSYTKKKLMGVYVASFFTS